MKKPLKLSTDVKKQHTVPRFLLDKFGSGKKGKKRRLYTFDKHNSRKFQQSVFDATTRNTFYNIEDHPDKASLEPILGIYETEAAPLIKKITELKSVGWLSEDDRFKIATFVAVQRARSYGELQRIEHAIGALNRKLTAMGATPEQIESELGSEGSSERKNLFLKMILDQEETVAHLMAKSWILYETNIRDPFFISDNPITLHNDIDMGLYGNLGIAINGKRTVENLLTTAPHLVQQIRNPLGLIDLGKAYETGGAVKQSSEKVRFINSLQVSFSEQYVFCEKDHFALIEEMIEYNEQYKSGPRMQVN